MAALMLTSALGRQGTVTRDTGDAQTHYGGHSYYYCVYPVHGSSAEIASSQKAENKNPSLSHPEHHTGDSGEKRQP
ncbi:hypothetical protein LIPSTDRAFT_265950 [Lipomyces starkeyi NRRL Y-11557]|uniref:Uncharacterized protein n=1 Tax=Lipomyces starkeyi NRRL Y-11557 TaxID=675824 RepID=A0A1E3Q7H2_LIPST|nr:hypothetical protein LIPSTDRAFT_265950 [Lipomyces starkeyi NRRL Y-11557]